MRTNPHPEASHLYQPSNHRHAASPDGRTAFDHPYGHGKYLYGSPCRLLCHFRRIPGGFHQYSGDPGLFRLSTGGTRCLRPACGDGSTIRSAERTCNA